MRTLLIACVSLLALTAAGAASGGGFATVGVSPQAPDEAGAVWRAKLDIKQHGRRPLDGLQPVITIRSDTGETQTFTAKPTGEPGIYAARVVFPSKGTWRYEINDGFTPWTHTFAPLTIGVGDGGGSSFPTWTLALATALALALGAALAATLRLRRRPDLAPAPTP